MRCPFLRFFDEYSGVTWGLQQLILPHKCPHITLGLETMYNPEAVAERLCTAKKADGCPCRAWAVWGDSRQLCASHGRHHRGKLRKRDFAELLDERSKKTRYIPCHCAAYKWPHRPGGGLCRWPLPPAGVFSTPAGTHSQTRLRPPWVADVLPDGGGLSVNDRLQRAGDRRAEEDDEEPDRHPPAESRPAADLPTGFLEHLKQLCLKAGIGWDD